MKVKMLLLLTLAYLTAHLASGVVAGDKDGDKLPGTYSLVSITEDGKKVPEKELEKYKDARVIFSGDRMVLKLSDKGGPESTYKTDPKKTPATIDMTAQSGKNKGKTFKG